ncbi:efflux RND transporter permease subunit [Thermoleptolyngbya sp. C42_A2020_037]|uniref:efflux RND transporter permease subunit n=1 Tax=Thermoleptolyngbya sp. C42_A2020_037 TaxID=2747799 RepID=UPI0019E7039D|nr:efflux RND transporter permease subunit [Thermoleptolyngbya sp. C42_A2020_037]MBF2083406.1 efflux RND transporter permease subunit [Thermoleptolyngbya sp. C42_A2020_037]
MTSLSTLSIRRHIGTLMLTLTAIVLGVFFLVRLPVDLLPSITYPRIGVRVDAPGVAPEVAVDEITRPLEQAFSATDGVQQIYSQTREGQVSVDLYFRPGGNIDRALNDATASFNRARSRLPNTIQEPRIFKFDPSQLPVYEFALTSDSLQSVDLRVFADEELARELSVVPGVASVDVSGGVREEVQVNVDINRLQALGVGLTDLLNALRGRNQDVSGGRLRGGEEEVLIRTVGRFQSAEDLRNLSLPVNGASSASGGEASTSSFPEARRVYLRDVAQVVDGTEEQRIFVTLNGDPAVKVSIQKQPDANTVSVVEGVKQRLAELEQAGLFPTGMAVRTTLDESRFIRNSISNVAMSGLIGALLAAIAVLLFLGSLRQTLIIVFAIPLATLIAILLMGTFGLTLNVFSLGGLALGVGIVVDNSIVMLESIVQGVETAKRRRAVNSIETAEYSTTEDVEIPDESNSGGHDYGYGNGHSNGHDSSNRHGNGNGNGNRNGRGKSNGNGNGNGIYASRGHDYDPSSDAENVTRGRTGKRVSATAFLLRQAELASQQLESALVASTTTNLVSVLPFLLIGGFFSLLFSQLILTISFAVAASLIVALTVVPMLTSRLLAVRWSSRVGDSAPLRAFRARLADATHTYVRGLSWVLRHRLVVIGLAIALFGGTSFWMAGQLPQEILPRINTGQARLNAQFAPGTSLADNRRVMELTDQILLQQPEVEYLFSTAGGSLFGTNTNANPLRGSSTITLKPGTNVAEFTERMTAELNRLNLVGTRLRLSPESVRGLIVNNSPVRGADVDILLQGSDTRALQQAGREVLAALDSQARQARYRPDADQAQPEIQVRPDWERASQLGLSTEDIGDTIQTAITGSVPTQLQRGDRLVDIRVQLADNAIQRPAQLAQLPVFTSGRQLVRLADVARIEAGEAPGEIQRINQRQIFQIVGNLVDGANLSDAIAESDAILAGLTLPEGVSRLPSASAQSAQEVRSSLILLGGLAAFLVFVVMAVQYNSLVDPLVIMLTVPLALAGGIFGLFLTQTAIGATVIVGAVLLVGIVVNNAIILVELANQIREEQGLDHRSAMLQAAPQRLQPILMTTITTVLGMFPLALGIGEGSEFLRPLGIVVFSGLSLATLLTLFIIPSFYTLLHEVPWAKGAKLGAKRLRQLSGSTRKQPLTK